MHETPSLHIATPNVAALYCDYYTVKRERKACCKIFSKLKTMIIASVSNKLNKNKKT